MPEIRNCRRCGKLYNYLGGQPICPDCKKLDEETFKRVKDYLYDNPGATISDVSIALDISVEKIKSYLREGRIEITNIDGNVILECESCGKAIRYGRYCDECTRELSRDLKSTAGQMSKHTPQSSQKNNSIGLRYLNKDK